ncbi:hypothetical protein V5799_009040 [Amblyomma americanum]|uniref:Uncharacterized protein n=1 Tax=Amblyomma americanum TaxID=6943 RepID=A0AAQ4FBD3_AMBAM
MAKLQQRAHYFLRTKVILTMEHKRATMLCPQFGHLRMVSAEEREEYVTPPASLRLTMTSNQANENT